MFVHRNIPASIIFRFAWKYLLIFIGWSVFWLFCHDFLHHHGIHVLMPFAPVSTIGVAVAFYLGFKNNQSYDRFWEARTIWGGIVNASRVWGNQVLSYISEHHNKNHNSKTSVSETHKRLIYRHLAYINALRLNLRKPTTFSPNYVGAVKNYKLRSTERHDWDEQVKPFLDEAEYERLSAAQNMPTQLLRNQSEDIQRIFEQKGLIEDFRHIDLMATIRACIRSRAAPNASKTPPFQGSTLTSVKFLPGFSCSCCRWH